MFLTIPRDDTDRHVYTHFYDMHSGGGTKTPYEHIFIQAPWDLAIEIFKEKFNQDPHDVACQCCGHNFSVYEMDSLAKATSYQRHVYINDGVELPEYPSDHLVNERHRVIKLTEYCLQPDVLIIQTRED